MTSKRQFLGALCLPAALILTPAWVLAQEAPAPLATPAATVLNRVNNIHLAYVRTTSAAMNADAQAGLKALADALMARTSIEAKDAAGIDLEKDDLSFYRFLYWPVTPDAAPLSERARQNLRGYINNGGVLLIDARAANGVMASMRAVRIVTDGLGIAPLEKVTKDHNLANQFYKELPGGLPGSTSFGSVEAEISDVNNGGRPTSVIVGANNWADAWAGKTVMKGSNGYEMAIRAGIHMVRYAYAGSARSISVQKILEDMKR